MRKFIGNINMPVNGAMDPYLRVVLSGGYLVAATATQVEIGVLEERVLSTDVVASVIPRRDSAARSMVASGAITAFVRVYADAGGQVTATANNHPRGWSLTAASGAGAWLTVLPDDNEEGGYPLSALKLSGLVEKAAAGVAAAGPITVAGTTVGQQVVAVFGTLTAGGPLIAFEPGTDFEQTVSVAGQIQQLSATDLHLDTLLFLLAPAQA